MKKTILLTAVATLAMVSCSNEQANETGDGQVAIVIGSSVSGIESRGVVNNNYTSFNAGIVAYTGTATVASPTFTQDPITFTSGQSTAVTDKYYPSNGDEVFFVGYAPAGAVVSGASCTFTIDGSQDVMYAPQVEGTKISEKPNLEFAHKLSLLRFLVKAEDAAAVTAWGNVTKIEVLGCNDEIVLDLSTGIATASGSVTFTSFDDSQALTTALAGVGEGTMVYPMDDEILHLKVYTTLYTGGQTVNLSSQSFDAGSAYNINLTFKATAIELTASVAEWVQSETDSEVDVK